MDRDIIDVLTSLHKSCALKGVSLQRKHLLEFDSSLTSRLENRKISWASALIQANIDPRCHLGQFSYGKTEEERKHTFRKLIAHIAALNGIKSLNDNSMNTNDQVEVPDCCWDYSYAGVYPECAHRRCQRVTVSKRSVYANGRRLFGNWSSALGYAKIDLSEVLRKPANLQFDSILDALDVFDVEHESNWSVTTIRYEKNELAKAIYNLKMKKSYRIPYSSISDDIMFVVWVNLMYRRETGTILEDMAWYTDSEKFLVDKFQQDHRAQETWDENKIVLGIHSIYAKGPSVLRISRDDVINRGSDEDKTVWAALRQRRFQDAGISETTWMKKSGVLIDKLRKKYLEIDERYSPKRCLEYFSNRMTESLSTGENRLTREFNSTFDSDFYNFMISKYKSWEKALEEHGLDPKFFSITASKRTKRGYRFQKFIEETFGNAGLVKVTRAPKAGEFVANRSLTDCSHKIKCKPDFLFEDVIIDTKTGYHASQKPEQILRYFDHKPNVIILTLNDKERIENIEGRPITVMGFDSFIQQSRQIIGVDLEAKLSEELSEVLKQHPFWG